MTYTNTGSVCGSCGHQHRTIRTAVECNRKHADGCKSQGGYSDRQVRHSDGSPLTDAEYDEACEAGL